LVLIVYNSGAKNLVCRVGEMEIGMSDYK